VHEPVREAVHEAVAFRALAFVVGVAALTPLVPGLLLRVRLPELVLLLAGGWRSGRTACGWRGSTHS
jgi:hypothetical protein